MTRVLAWGVHLFTALGLVAAAFMAVLIFRGGPGDFRLAFILMFAATLVDAVDGTLARLARVKEVLPGFDGRRLDDLIDFLTYTCLPLLLIWRAHLVPEGWDALLLFPLLASVYGFSQVEAKTPDGYFLGFPSYWNIIAFYLYYLELPLGLNAALLALFALVTFVPTCYLYTTQPGRFNRVTNIFAGVWIVFLIAVLSTTGERAHSLAVISSLFPFYYLGASWIISARRARVRDKNPAVPSSQP